MKLKNSKLSPWIAVPLALALSSGCAAEADTDLGTHQVQGSPPAPDMLDVLFVVDNSGSMAEEQASMAANFQALIEQLENMPSGMPSLHVGVVSTDVGAGPHTSGCEGVGDNGTLIAEPSLLSDCTGPTDAFIKRSVLADGSISTNYSGSLAETFQCIANIGVTGCGFEQPLESMRRALGSNPGFLRAEASLAIIIISDEDDCSASDLGLFDPNEDGELGPMSSFRCTEQGLLCDGEVPLRSAKSYTSCAPAPSANWLFHPDEFVSFLSGLKGGTDGIMVAVIAGDRNGLSVDEVDGHPSVSPSCSSGNGTAIGAYRLGYFAEQFDNNLVTSICEPELTGALASTGAMLADALKGADDDNETLPEEESQAGGCSTTGGGGSGLLALFALIGLGRRRRERL